MTTLCIRIVPDTNVLVAAAYAPRSASRRIVEACLRGDLVAIASRATIREYDWILQRAIRKREYEQRLRQLVDEAELAEPAQTPRHVPDDPEDDKFLAAALAGAAGWIVTNDRHLLELDPYCDIRIVRPGEFTELMGL